MAKKKHQFHCEKCGQPCEIYKKGKKHRVLVCPECGVIATNPLPLVAGAMLASAASSLFKKKEKPTAEAKSGSVVVNKGDFYKYKEHMLSEALR